MNDEPLIEATVEMVLIEHPELIKPGLRFIEKREKINGAGIINLVFEDVKLEKRVLVEVKRGTASRQDIGQVNFILLVQGNTEITQLDLDKRFYLLADFT